MLMEAFDKYKYWSTKGLREHTSQPEVYLKEVLSTVADFHKRGPYAKNWSLKPEYANARSAETSAQPALHSTPAAASGGWGLSQNNTSTQPPQEESRGQSSAGEDNDDDDDDDDGEDFEDIT